MSATIVRRAAALAVFTTLSTASAAPVAATPPDSPLVSMLVTLPGGEVRTVAAHDSETVTLALPDGTVVGVRPTILDSKPWNRTVVTFFTMPTSSRAAEETGSVEVRTGGPSVAVKAPAGIKVAVSTVALDPTGRVSRARTSAPSTSAI